MDSIQDLDCLQVDRESVKTLAKLKNAVLNKYKLSTNRTQEALALLAEELFIYNRNSELHELCEFVIRQGKVPSNYLPPFYALYICSSMNKKNSPEHLLAQSFLLEYGPLRWDDAFDVPEKMLSKAKEGGLGIDSIKGRLQTIMRIILLDLSFGDKSRFGTQFLEKKLDSVLSEIRALLKITV